MDIIQKARMRAKKAHHGQTRKGSAAPYFTHPEAVAQLVQESGGSDYLIAAAYLHDVLEDTNTPIHDFPDEVRNVVEKLTHKGGYAHAKIDAIKKLEGDKDAILVKLADRLHNLSDSSFKRDRYASRKSVQQSTNILLAMAVDAGLAHTKVFRDLDKLMR
ncbi:MAG: HD domain-containing protein [Candidatus Lokiarchaeota archaeon]|nr:HD domain-containing protein [Candidatus Lokiarchaeota archaeon]